MPDGSTIETDIEVTFEEENGRGVMSPRRYGAKVTRR
jgi:hypothetical protein